MASSSSKSQSGLKCIQINLQHSQTATAVLCRELARLHTQFIALIQEPWVNGTRIRGLSSKLGTLFCTASNTDRPRACVFVGNGVKAVALPQYTRSDAVAVQVDYLKNGKTAQVILCSAYFPFEAKDGPPTEEFRKLVDYCSRRKLHLLASCDVNAHNTVWGSTDTNGRGQALLEYLAGTDLEILNIGNEPTFVNSRRQEVIDLTVCTGNLAPEVSGWQVSREPSFSDHCHIHFSICGDAPKPVFSRNRKKTNWGIFTRELKASELDGTCATVEEIEQEVSKVEGALISAFHAACPLRKIPVTHKVPWWNRELSGLRKAARRLFKRAFRSKTTEDWARYREAHQEYKKGIRQSKNTSWKQFCTDIDSTPKVAKLYRALSKDPVGQFGMLQCADGSFTSTREEALEVLLSAHFPGCSSQPVAKEPQPPIPTVRDWDLARKIVSKDRVEWAVKSFKPYKAPGEDGIFPALLQWGLDSLTEPLVRIYRACLALGYIPIPWRKTRVVFIPKPGKESYNVAKAFRPISLMSFLLKGLERLVDRHLRDGPLKSSPLHNNQHAYRAGRSTDTALHALVSRIEEVLRVKSAALAVFYDIEGAFNNTSFEAVEEALRCKQVHPLIIRWIGGMLQSRVVTVSSGDVTKTAWVIRGCPQGGVLSPLLWSLVIDSLLVEMNQERFYTQGYSDDGVTLIAGKFLGTIGEVMQTALNRVQKWCQDRGLSVNPSKTEMVLFTRKRNVQDLVAPDFFGRSLRLTNQVKYLGVTLDSKLLWTPHVTTKVEKAIRALWQCRRMVGRCWGLSPRIAHWMYTVIVRPMVLHAAVVWWTATQKVTLQKELTRLQRLACMMIAGAVRTTPTAALEVLFDLAPLHIVAEKEAMAAAYRMIHSGSWYTTGVADGHRAVRQLLYRRVREAQWRGDHIYDGHFSDKAFTVDFPSRQDWQGEEGNLCPPEDIVCFTDGSRREGTSGSGVYIPSRNIELALPLGKFATVFQSEVYAILRCASLESLQRVNGEQIFICSDSMATIKALARPLVRSALVLECKQALNRLSITNRVTVRWIPGHEGHQGNEEADRLANEGAGTPFHGPEPVLPVAKNTVTSRLNDWCRDQHCEWWRHRTDCRQGRELIESPRSSKTRKFLALAKGKLRVIVGVLTGHGCLNRHLNIMGLVDNPTCPLCQQGEESSMHFLVDCAALTKLRICIWGSAQVDTDTVKWLKLGDLLRFIKSSKRFPMLA